MHETLQGGGFLEGSNVVVALTGDEAAREATNAVSAQLLDASQMTFSAIEDVVGLVAGHESWKNDFAARYLDFHHSE
jgi:hypothetical protein